jgi:hypothetical protein
VTLSPTPAGVMPGIFYGVKTMAARIRKHHQDDVRAKIQASQLINRLMGHIEGKTQLAPTQINAIKILLDKSLPNLSDIKMEHYL